MSTSKTVNITNGKVLDYTIQKEGYKTINGSKYVMNNESLSLNMIPKENTDGIYMFGDRIGDCASFIGYFNYYNRTTQQEEKMACFALDARYRTMQVSGYGFSNINELSPATPLDITASDTTGVFNCKDSATWNTNAIFNTYSVSSSYFKPFYYARNPNGSSFSIEVGGVTYYPQLPTLSELRAMLNMARQIDIYDPTVSSYSSRRMTNFDFAKVNYGYKWAYCSNMSSNNTEAPGYYAESSNLTNVYASIYLTYSNGNGGGVAPVFEIPVN